MHFGNLFLCFFWAMLVSVFAIPSIISVAHTKKLLDEPNSRTVHEMLTPRLGGLAIFAGFLSALSIFGIISDSIQYLVAGCIIIFFIGLKDDIVTVSAFKKFFVQVLSTSIVLFVGDVRITGFHGIFGIGVLDLGVSYLFSAIVIIGITNSINLIDGLDGLAGIIVFIICITFGVSFFLFGGEKFALYGLVAFSLAGAVVGFLRYNLYKAIIFMGDAGSLTCGFIVAVLSIKFVEMDYYPNSSSPIIAMSVLYLPIMDTLRVFVIRVFAGKSPFSPDKNHIHHLLVSIGYKQPMVITILAILNVLIIFISYLFSSWGNTFLLSIFALFSILFFAALKFIKDYKIADLK